MGADTGDRGDTLPGRRSLFAVLDTWRSRFETHGRSPWLALAVVRSAAGTNWFRMS